jgi:hypothetical protein
LVWRQLWRFNYADIRTPIEILGNTPFEHPHSHNTPSILVTSPSVTTQYAVYSHLAVATFPPRGINPILGAVPIAEFTSTLSPKKEFNGYTIAPRIEMVHVLSVFN